MLSTLWFSLFVAIGLYGISSYVKPLDGRRNWQKLFMGVLSLAYAATCLHATYALVFAHLPYASFMFRTVRGAAGGMFVSLFTTLVYRSGAKTMLIIAAVLFICPPLALLITPRRVLDKAGAQLISTWPEVYIREAFPVGLAIPAIVLLVRGRSENDKEQENRELNAEEGSEA
jgi:hypothetical protein